MASRRAIETAARRAAMKPADVRALADKLFAAKRRVYRRSLLRTIESLGLSISRPSLSDNLEDVIRGDAERSADFIATHFNRDLAQFAATLTELPNTALADEISRWKNARARSRARPTAITEAYAAHTDALVSAVSDLGLADDALWDFGGHPDDADPACSICRELALRSPWPTSAVVEIGTPHVQCRQDWHLRAGSVDPRGVDLESIVLGAAAGGVLGRAPLIARAGGRAQAVEAVVDLATR